MKWYSAYEVLQSDGLVRLPEWEEGEYIYMASEPTEDGILYLMNQDDTYIELTDEELLTRVKAKCEAKLNYQSRLLMNRLRFFAERQNSLPVWETDENLKYYIVWSGITNKYYIESTYKDYYNGLIHFNSRTACQTAIATYKPMLDMVRKLDFQYNQLCSLEYSREQLMEIDKMLENIK